MNVSVCIPTYNRPLYLKEAFDSCMSQTHLPYEIIIGDDSKNDESKNLIQELTIANTTTVKIVYQKNSVSLGQAANVNSLIQVVTGDVFVLLHDDDLLLPNALQVMTDSLKSTNADAVFGKQYIVTSAGQIKDKNTEELNRYFFRTSEYEGVKLSSLESAMLQQFPNDCFMVKAGIAKKIGYRTKKEAGDAVDFDFGLRLGLGSYKFYFVNEFVAKYRLSEVSVSRNAKTEDTAYQAFKLLSPVIYTKSSDIDYKDMVLKRKAPIAIMQAINNHKKKDAFKIYFSKYHLNKILSLGGMKRLIYLLGKW